MLPREACRPLPKPSAVPPAPTSYEDDVVGGPGKANRIGIVSDQLTHRLHPRGPGTWLEDPDNRNRALRQQGIDLDRAKTETISTYMAPDTRASYDSCWNRWEIFCRIRRESPFMYGTSPDTRRLGGEQTLDYTVHLSRNMGKAPGTIKNYISAVSTKHEVLGLDRPSDRMRQVKPALRGLRKLQGATSRKHPVTPQMLKWSKSTLDLSKADDALVWSGVCTG